jgi:hypothetical protein
MKKITAKEFYAMISKNPSVFEHWDSPLEITEFIQCSLSPITHLSKHLTFSGKSGNGDAAHFSNCKHLKVATGTFTGFVLFFKTGVETIDNLVVTEPNQNGAAAQFFGCKYLQTATGTYPGHVCFTKTGIHGIHKLDIQKPYPSGEYARFVQCPNLQNLEGWDLSKPIHIEPKKLEAERKRRAALQKFARQTQPKELPFL